MDKCMGTCLYFEEIIYQDDLDSDEKYFDYCNLKHHAVKEEDCNECEEWENGWS